VRKSENQRGNFVGRKKRFSLEKHLAKKSLKVTLKGNSDHKERLQTMKINRLSKGKWGSKSGRKSVHSD